MVAKGGDRLLEEDAVAAHPDRAAAARAYRNAQRPRSRGAVGPHDSLGRRHAGGRRTDPEARAARRTGQGGPPGRAGVRGHGVHRTRDLRAARVRASRRGTRMGQAARCHRRLPPTSRSDSTTAPHLPGHATTSTARFVMRLASGRAMARSVISGSYTSQRLGGSGAQGQARSPRAWSKVLPGLEPLASSL